MTAGRFFGYVLFVGGLLLAVTAGGCTLLFGGTALVGFIGTGFREAGDYVWAVLLFGGIPILIGVGMLWLGRKLLRVYPASAADATPPTASE